MVKTRDEEKNGFKVSTIEISNDDLYLKKQFIRRQDRLYVVTGASRKTGSSIIKEFFEAVMLIKDGMVMSPNVGDKLEEASKVKMLLPRSLAESPSTLVADDIVDEAAADRRAVIVFQPSLELPPADSRFQRTFNQVKVSVLLRSDGTVGDVSAVTRTTQSIEREALKAARNIRFLPAEKGGKAVSVYRTVDFSLSIN